MKSKTWGFTLVEVSLFLAVTALLFLGVTMGVRGSIFQQRYNDSVQNFAEFLRSVYAETMNVEHAGTGASEQAIYGKMVTFGESYDLAGQEIAEGEDKVFSYTVVGDIGSFGTGSVLDTLKSLNINVLAKKGETYVLAGISQEYIPKWNAGLQTTAGFSAGQYTPFKGTLLIIRHPRSGTVYTYFYDGVIEVNGTAKNSNNTVKAHLLSSKLTEENFRPRKIDICVNPMGQTESNMRRNIRIIENARNASGIEVLSQDSGDNLCE